MKKCLIFARVSTGDQETANQIDQLKGYAAKQGWSVLEVIEEVVTGSKSAAERGGLKRVFELAHRKQFDVLLFWSLDRLSREGSRATIQYLQRLEDAGVDWHSYTEEYLSSLGVFKDCIISLLSALARQERLRISERTKAGLERTRKNGTRIGRPKTPPTKIREAVRLKAQGLSFGQIGKQMGISRARAFQLVKAEASTTRGTPARDHQSIPSRFASH